MLRTILIYGTSLAVGTLALQWLKDQYLVRIYPLEVLELKAAGRSNKEIAARLAVSPRASYGRFVVTDRGSMMIRPILVYGTVAGLVVAVPMVWQMTILNVEDIPENAALYGYLTMILALTAVFAGVKRYRDKALGGVIGFWPALAVGLGISAVASATYTVGWEISLTTSGFDFAESYTQTMLESARADGASQTELERLAAEAADFTRIYANPLYRLPITFVEMFPVGVLISLFSAAVLRNSRVLPARARA